VRFNYCFALVKDVSAFTQYVANVATIQETVGQIEWRHVRSEDNPVDALFRGQLPRSFIQQQTWFTRPPWLINDEIEWPNERAQISETPKLKKNTCLTYNDIGIFDKYSSYSKLLRIITYCLRFFANY